MKKLISILIVFCMVFIFPVSAFAAENTETSDENGMQQGGYGILTSDTGETLVIKGNLVSSNMSRSIAGDISQTYEYAVPSSAVLNGSTSVDGPDSGYSSHVYLTLHYRMRQATEHGGTEYLVTSVSGYWTIEDPRVCVTSSSVYYACTDLVAGQTGSSSNLSNPFSISTGFSEYIFSNFGALIKAELTLSYLMGTSRRWTFTLHNEIASN